MRCDPKPLKRVRDAALMKRLHLEMEGEPCERCERAIGVALHHKTFRSQSGDDVRANLEWLCPSCHDAAHGL
jgi:5-methylcytosine-specific restriction endonuclease McrA